MTSMPRHPRPQMAPEYLRQKATEHAADVVNSLEMGEKARGKIALMDGLELDPHHPALLWTAASTGWLREAPNGKAIIDLSREALEYRDPLLQGEAADLHFAMARCYEAEGDYDQAWSEYREGNAIYRTFFAYSRDHYVEVLPSYLRMNKEHIREADNRADAARVFPGLRCGFVMGLPRSGTTLAEQVVAAHPNGYGADELSLFSDLMGRHIGLDACADPVTIRRKVGWEYEEGIRAGFAQRQKREIRRVIDKMPDNILLASTVRLALPLSRAVIMRRDPLATAISCLRTPFSLGHGWSCDPVETAWYIWFTEQVSEHWLDILPRDWVIPVEYEALAASLAAGEEGPARRLVEHFGLTWTPAAAQACLAPHEVKNKVTTASMAQVRERPYTSSIDGHVRHFWKHLEPVCAEFDRLGLAYRTP